MPHLKLPLCLACGPAWEKNPQGRRPSAKLPENHPRFCGAKCAADYAYRMAADPSLHLLYGWCRKHEAWFDARKVNVHGVDIEGRCQACQADEKAAKKASPPPERILWMETWTESERGWGCRPDGYTLHLSRADLDRYVTAYNRRHNNKSEVPDEYTRADENPRMVRVSEAVFQYVAENLSEDGGVWGPSKTPCVDPEGRLEVKVEGGKLVRTDAWARKQKAP